MSGQDAYERILTSLHHAVLDDARWPATSALIDEGCGLTGNALLVGQGREDDVQVSFVGLYQRGRRRQDLEGEYLASFHTADERIPRLRRRPYGRLMHIKNDQYTSDELKRSRAYNEFLVRVGYGDSLAVTLDGLAGTHISWSIADSAGTGGWGLSQIALVKSLVPQGRQFVLVRQALVRAGVRSATVAGLLGNSRVGVVHLDRQGRILAVNDRAVGILGEADGLVDRKGVLRASAPDDRRRLDRLLAVALPLGGAVAVGGTMALRRTAGRLPFIVHINPLTAPEPDYGAQDAAALVLIVEPDRRRRVNADLVAAALGLTPAESRVAVGLAEGGSVAQMAEATQRTKGAIYWHLKQIYQKLGISRQVDLIRVVLSIAELG